MNRFDITLGKKPKKPTKLTLEMLKVKRPFIQILDSPDDYYRIKVVFPLCDKKGNEICKRGGIIQFRPESFHVTSGHGEYVAHVLPEL